MVLGVSGVLGGLMTSLLTVPLVSKHLVSGVSWVVGSRVVAMVTFSAMLPSALQALTPLRHPFPLNKRGSALVCN